MKSAKKIMLTFISLIVFMSSANFKISAESINRREFLDTNLDMSKLEYDSNLNEEGLSIKIKGYNGTIPDNPVFPTLENFFTT